MYNPKYVEFSKGKIILLSVSGEYLPQQIARTQNPEISHIIWTSTI